ncbi:DUF2264 domain-containing protein [Schleiferilactobacillus perolens]|uniref:DUF2264 domain-containing protein n=1 Tax=Schleiferilactobacillus perolens DSM 12744 TaxID=1423792 RepID=A0A0R1N2B9_9LACO|nr:DUF2264 domain-containing protein [Schleiferilactobacillus perolens]KRL14365.1 hypothetical protein FD09_GL000010 [Schleiferilactobacillus perolens DSM 12744]
MIGEKITDRESLLAYFDALLAPTKKYRQTGNGRLNLGSSATHYSDDEAQIEGFLRQLWAVGPLYGQGILTDSDFKYYRQAILDGVNPQHQYYWGQITDYDQLIVEMAALAVTLIETKVRFWDTLNKRQQNNIYHWLNQVNSVGVWENNWRFFRILVNVAFIKLGQPADHKRLVADLELIDTMALPDGWYFDGNPRQMDYYIPWAMHFYGLLYAHYMAKEDPEHSAQFVGRAKAFAQSFQYWFDRNGAAVPFGRSLTYRFAQAAFWSVCVFTNVEALPWGQMKSLIFNHLNYWQTLPITKPDGVLSIGYGYENLYMSEHYNGPGSPYWSFKTFIVLAVPADHPFWAAPMTQPKRAARIQIAPAKMLVTNQGGTNVMLYPSGQYSSQAHSDEKYSKFVYSSRFAFSVGTGRHGLEDGAFDSVLAVAEDQSDLFVAKGKNLASKVTTDWVQHTWSPLPNVGIVSTIIPLGEWHVRIHQIVTQRALQVADGGFSNLVPDSHADSHPALDYPGGLAFQSSIGTTAIVNMLGYKKLQAVFPSPNSNLVYSHTVILTTTVALSPGTYLLISAHYGGTDLPLATPDVDYDGKQVTVGWAGKDVVVPL